MYTLYSRFVACKGWPLIPGVWHATLKAGNGPGDEATRMHSHSHANTRSPRVFHKHIMYM